MSGGGTVADYNQIALAVGSIQQHQSFRVIVATSKREVDDALRPVPSHDSIILRRIAEPVGPAVNRARPIKPGRWAGKD